MTFIFFVLVLQLSSFLFNAQATNDIPQVILSLFFFFLKPTTTTAFNEDYTIIRPGFMGDVDAVLEEDKALVLADDGGDLKVTAIPHRTVAEALLFKKG